MSHIAVITAVILLYLHYQVSTSLKCEVSTCLQINSYERLHDSRVNPSCRVSGVTSFKIRVGEVWRCENFDNFFM